VTRLVALLVAVAVVGVACSENDGARDDPQALPTGCGLPTPDPGLEPSDVPDRWVLDGAEVTRASRDKGRLVLALNLPYPVVEVMTRYRKIVVDAGFDLVSVDNEIFEAEVFFERGPRVGAVQIRRSVCKDASVAFVSVVKVGRLPIAPTVTPTPTPTG
jgi:hypothetical protein